MIFWIDEGVHRGHNFFSGEDQAIGINRDILDRSRVPPEAMNGRPDFLFIVTRGWLLMTVPPML